MSKDAKSFGDDRTPKKSESDSKLNTLQIIAATGAATTGAIVASSLGIYGTVIGVAVISVISSVGTAVFLQSMNRTRDRLRKAAGRDEHEDEATGGTVTQPAVTAIRRAAADPTGATRIDQPTRPPGSRRIKWHAVAVTSAVVFVLSLGVLTGIALLAGQPPAAFYGNSPTQPVSTPAEPSEFGPGDREQDAPAQTSTPEDSGTPSTEGPGDDESPDDPASTPSEPDSPPPSSDPGESPDPDPEPDPEDEE